MEKRSKATSTVQVSSFKFKRSIPIRFISIFAKNMERRLKADSTSTVQIWSLNFQILSDLIQSSKLLSWFLPLYLCIIIAWILCFSTCPSTMFYLWTNEKNTTLVQKINYTYIEDILSVILGRKKIEMDIWLIKVKIRRLIEELNKSSSWHV